MKKPIGICGVSSGGFGGARMIENLLPVLIAFKMIPLKDSVYFSNVHEVSHQNGTITDQAYEKKVNTLLEEMNWYARALKPA